jgi:hypothetical protein
LLGSRINVEHFYGIEIDDFAVEVAILSLWIAKHQMNVEFKEKFGIDLPLIPLKEAGKIVHGNATQANWREICPSTSDEEIYLIGNPPYLGSRNQSVVQKAELKQITPNYKSLDYISAWFIKGADYIRGTKAELAFVSTNSVTQGEQVSLLWPHVLGDDLEIGYAYTSFEWANQAKNTAGVTCVIVNLRSRSNKPKFLNSEEIWQECQHINAYLAATKDIYLSRRSSPIAHFMPTMTFGSMPNDGGNLILSETERNSLISKYPNVAKYIKRFSGATEFISGKVRWCLVVPDSDVALVSAIPEIAARFERVSAHRAASTEASTKKLASHPNQFYFFAHKETPSIIVPCVSTDRRDYIPIDFLDNETVISNSANAVYDAEPFVFGILTSRMHMVWMRAVAGRMRNHSRYSATLVYNNFPVPPMKKDAKLALEQAALAVLDAREHHSESTLSDLYDPDKMPEDLQQAHRKLDVVVDSMYKSSAFDSDEERLSKLFDLYESMNMSASGKLL